MEQNEGFSVDSLQQETKGRRVSERAKAKRREVKERTHLEILEVLSSRIEIDPEVLPIDGVGSLDGSDVLVLGGPASLIGGDGLGETREDGRVEVEEEGVVREGGFEEVLQRRTKEEEK